MRLLLPCLLVACAPAAVHFRDDPSVADVEPLFPIDARRVDARLTEGPLVRCDAPPSAGSGFERRVSEQPPSSMSYLWASGILVGDLDDDGVHDMVAPSEPFAELYLGRTHGGARRVGNLEPFDLSFGAGGSLADYDGDGDLDVFLARFDRADVLLRNDGQAGFTDVTDRAGVGARGPSTSSSWGDVDRDGDLDLFVARYGDLLGGGGAAPSLLYENLGDGTFLDRSVVLPDAVQLGWTRMAGFHDIDLDGFPELIVINDLGHASLVLWNVGGRLVADDGSSGLSLSVRGAGLGIGELNGDGVPDMLVTEWNRVSLLESRVGSEGLAWVDHAPSRGLVPDRSRGQAVPWGAELADVDNDGLLDAVVAFGHFQTNSGDASWNNPFQQPDAIFLQTSEGDFVDVAPEWGMDDAGVGRGFVLADLNADGRLDLVKRDLEGPNVLYLSTCNANAWSLVRLRQEGTMNHFAVGATVRVEAGGRVHQREIAAGGTGFGTGGPPEAHFGLGAADWIDAIEVIWPDGEVSRVEGLEPRRVVTLSR